MSLLPSLLVAMLGLVPGCGSSSTDDTTAVTATILSDAAIDGDAWNDGMSASSVGTGYPVGDIDGINNGAASRLFFHFSLLAIPPGATVLSATLVVNQSLVAGTPYATHGVVTVDHLDFGATLDVGDYASAALTSAYGTLSPDALLGSKVLDVTSAVVADRLALRTRTQFRARFTLLDTDSDAVNDFAVFTDGERSDAAPPGSEPRLTIVYAP